MVPISLSSLEIRMKVLSLNYHNFKKFSVLTQVISFLENKSVSYTMVYTPCFEEIYSNIRNQSGCFCEMSFLKAGLYCTVKLNLRTLTIEQTDSRLSKILKFYEQLTVLL